ncbi:hypothetical protein LTR66_007762 [Elasticomyces elasticus]|nr:hypothetical protein LTR50_005433 [Elasticomyces elasticus]KAK4986817.1 hypothetical protein LTR66_007762 [Elasticomyces elasticus]
MSQILQHPALGPIKGISLLDKLWQFRSIPYASISQRFARSKPRGSAQQDAQSNQLPTDGIDEQEQSEDCLRVTITRPLNLERHPVHAKLPVVVFLHGGAFFLGSGERPWLSPLTFCCDALKQSRPLLFVSMNYRLGALGFFHSPEASGLIPPNNGLHDQIRGFEWIRKHIAGFGGDPDNITAIGQSAGGESLSLHNLSGHETPLYRRSITLSGSLVTMPPKSPSQHQENFLKQAKGMGIPTEDRSSVEIAQDMCTIDIQKIRETTFVGAPCTSDDVMPYDWPTMQLARSAPSTQVSWLESQIVSSCTYDGSISYIMTSKNEQRKGHAKSFLRIAEELLHNPQSLLDIYDMSAGDDDPTALLKICQFESDIGFLSAALSQATGSTRTKTYLQLFELGNPFEGLLPQNKFATHTWDIVALLGAFEARLPGHLNTVVREWRKKIIEYITSGTEPCAEWRVAGAALLVDNNGVKSVAKKEFMGGGSRLDRLWALAEAEKGEEGSDFLWEGLCRRWLDRES